MNTKRDTLFVRLGWNLQWTLIFCPQQKCLCSRDLPPFLNFSTFFSWSACLWRRVNSTWTIKRRLIVSASKCPGKFFNLSGMMGEFNQVSVKTYQDSNGRKPQRIRKDSITTLIAVLCPQSSHQVSQPLPNFICSRWIISCWIISWFFWQEIFTQDIHGIMQVPALASRHLLSQCTFLLPPVKAALGSCALCCHALY